MTYTYETDTPELIGRVRAAMTGALADFLDAVYDELLRTTPILTGKLIKSSHWELRRRGFYSEGRVGWIDNPPTNSRGTPYGIYVEARRAVILMAAYKYADMYPGALKGRWVSQNLDFEDEGPL